MAEKSIFQAQKPSTGVMKVIWFNRSFNFTQVDGAVVGVLYLLWLNGG